MTTLIIDGKEYQVSDGHNLLHACLSLGLNLPYFCWHPCLGSVGACRQCAVKVFQDENDERGRLVMACMTPASDGTRLSVEDKQAKDFRAGIIELLMTNHPHDCPVCEEGGECHLQDMTEMTGHTWRTYRNTKRTHRNQNLGPFINHEMNRCIACYRCVRYYQDYAGGHDLQAMGAHNHVYFGRHCDGALESPFSGNLVEVCPTGVFTDKTFSQHYSRKWDLQTAPSVCQHCGLGCNTAPGERYGRLKRISNRYHSEINGYFLCDRGRFGYGFVNSDQRLRQPQLRQEVNPQTSYQDTGDYPPAIAVACDTDAALRQLRPLLGAGKPCLGIGSPRASLESNFALQQVVGKDNFYTGFATHEEGVIRRILHTYRSPSVRVASLKDVEDCDAILVLGEDLTQTAPLLALRLRQAVRQRAKQLADDARIPQWQDAAVRELAQQEKSPLFVLHPTVTDLDDIAEDTSHLRPDAIADWGCQIARRISDNQATTEDSSIEKIASTLAAARRPLVIAGSSLFHTGIVDAAAAIAEALQQQRTQPTDIHCVVPECNSLGLALLTEDQTDRHLEAALERIDNGNESTLIVLENDLYRRHQRQPLDQALNRIDTLVVMDTLWHDTCAKADLILPAASFAETDGTLINSEGRAQRFFAVYPLDPACSLAQPSWQWLNRAKDCGWSHFDELTQACAEAHPNLMSIVHAAPDADYRQDDQKIPRMSHRYSGRTAIHANVDVSEPQQPTDPNSPLGFTMEGSCEDTPSSLRASAWSPGWNSNQSIHKFQQEVGGPLRGGPAGIRLLDAQESTERPREQVGADTESMTTENCQGLLPIPLYHIFGSEELSAQADPIQQRIPSATAALNPDDAERLALTARDGVEFEVNGSLFQLGLVLRRELPPGLIGLPLGMAGLTPAHLKQPLSIRKAEDWQPPAANPHAQVIASDKSTGVTCHE